MKLTKWQKQRTFGPVIEQREDGSFRASCTWCAFRVHVSCTHVRPPRRMDDPENTPEWCEMRADMLREAQEMAQKHANATQR